MNRIIAASLLVLLSSTAKSNDLHLPMRYLIGADNPQGRSGYITVMPYDTKPAAIGLSAAYGNLLDETNSGSYGPYLRATGTSKEYREGLINPHGPGFLRNLNDQFDRRWREGFKIIELDNPDSYGTAFTIVAINAAQERGFLVLAKNPLLLSTPTVYLSHPAVVGAIVERGAGDPQRMDRLRIAAEKPNLPVWFVAFGGKGKAWANTTAKSAKTYRHMGVTWSSRGEYTNSIDILLPR